MFKKLFTTLYNGDIIFLVVINITLFKLVVIFTTLKVKFFSYF